jgi:NAD(P)H dehydrogenase (quinone)
MHAPAKSSYPVCQPNDLLQYDAVLFGIPTRYGNFPAQWKTFWDATGSIWATGGYWGKYAGLFISTGTLGGGQESTAISTMSTLTHHGFVYVPLGYKHTFAQLANLEEIHGGSPWGAGTFAVSSLYTLFFLYFRTQCSQLVLGCRRFPPAYCSRIVHC